MTTETISGKCPCCGYDKVIMYADVESDRYGIDGCVNCGFGVSDIYDGDVGFDEWKDYAIHLYSMAKGIDEFEKDFEDECGSSDCDFTGMPIITFQSKAKKAYNHSVEILNSMDDDELRKKLFDWVESEERDDLYDEAVFTYNPNVIDRYRKKGVKIFKEIK